MTGMRAAMHASGHAARPVHVEPGQSVLSSRCILFFMGKVIATKKFIQMQILLSVIFLLSALFGPSPAAASPPDPLSGPPSFGARPEAVRALWDAPPQAEGSDRLVFAAELTGKPALAAYYFSGNGLCWAFWAYRELPAGATGAERAFVELSAAAAARFGPAGDGLTFWTDDPAIARRGDWLSRLGVRGYRLERAWTVAGARLTVFLSGPEERPTVGLEWAPGPAPACREGTP